MYLAAALAFAGCSKNEILIDQHSDLVNRTLAIEFGEAVPDNATRASYTAGASFQVGDQIAVFGYQDGNALFNDQIVTNDGAAVWSYSPVKYWNINSAYEFYAFFPASLGHSFGGHDAPYFSVPTFTVADAKDDQVDVMIAKKNQTRPYNTVDLVFNHILSNVNFYFKVASAFDLTGISSIEVKNFDITGLKSTGKYDQTGISASNVAVGAWSTQSGTYDFPAVTTGTVAVSGGTANSLTLADDLLLLPQTFDGSEIIKVSYILNYSDGTQSTFDKSVKLATIVGTLASNTAQKDVLNVWKPNFRYNYILAVNPSGTNIIFTESDYDGTLTGGDEVDNGVIVIDDSGNLWVDVDNDGIGDYPVVWEDIDGDGKLEGGVDRDGDGKIDDVDQDGTFVTPGTATGDKTTEPSDGTTTGDNAGKDVIMVVVDGTWVQLEDVLGPFNPIKSDIEFTATVEDWSDTYDADYTVK